MENKDILVVVLSRNYSTGLSVIRSLGSKGYTVDLVASAPKEGASSFIAKSRFIRNAYEAASIKVKHEDDTELVDLLLQYEDSWPTKPVIIAADDYTASVMDKHRDRLEHIFIMPHIRDGEPGSLTRMMDKSIQSGIARKVGIKTPKEWVVSLRDEIFDIPDEMIYPCYVKPLGSSVGYKQEMARCDDIDELIAHLHKLRDFFSDRSVLVQEFLYIDEEYDMEGVCMDQDVIIPGIIHKEIVAQYNKGVPLYGKLYPTEKFGAFMEKAYEFLRQFHYYGMFDLGFNVIDGEYYFNELNLRSGGTNYVYFESGANLSDAYVRAALGEPLDPETCHVTEFGKQYLYEKVAWDDYFHRHLTKEQLDECIENADIHIMVNDYDPIPGEIFNENMAAREEHIRQVKLRNRCITRMVNDLGLEKEAAAEELGSIAERLGIGYEDIMAFRLWQYPSEDQEEEYRKACDKRERLRKLRDECVAFAMETMGWDEETARENIKDARGRLDVSYKDYIAFSLCKYPPEEQEAAYKKAYDKRERLRKQKAECIAFAMETMGWDEETARESIKDTRRRFDVSYKDYVAFSLCKYPPEEQEEAYKKAYDKRERLRKQKADCIAFAMETMGWDEETARENIRDTRKRIDVSYKDYVAFSLCKYPPEEQEEEYRKAIEKRERLKKLKEECIAYTMDIMGWDEETAKAEIKDARSRLGISYKDYKKYRFCMIPVERQAEEYAKICEEKSRKSKIKNGESDGK